MAAENNIDTPSSSRPSISPHLAALRGRFTSISMHRQRRHRPSPPDHRHIPETSGFGNSTTSPSSGFFNSGAGSASGTGTWCGASGISGYLNVGALGVRCDASSHRLGGFYNASAFGPRGPAFMRDSGHDDS